MSNDNSVETLCEIIESCSISEFTDWCKNIIREKCPEIVFMERENIRRRREPPKIPSIITLGYSTDYNIKPSFHLDLPSLNIENLPSTADVFQGRLWHNTNLHKVHAIISVGQNKCLGLITVEKKFQFAANFTATLIQFLRSTNNMSPEKAIEYIKYIRELMWKVGEISQKIYSSYSPKEVDISNLKHDSLMMVYSELIEALHSHRYINRDKISEIVVSSIDTLLRDETGISVNRYRIFNSAQIFRKTLISAWNQNEKLRRVAYSDGVYLGIRLLTGFLNAGYTFNTSENRLEKDVHIVPAVCIRNGEFFSIAKKDQKYKVTTLIYNISNFNYGSSEFSLYASGQKHPNISGTSGYGKICIGTENSQQAHKIIFNSESEDPNIITDLLLTIEKSLAVINYDSSYEVMHKGMSSRLKKLENTTALNIPSRDDRVLSSQESTARRI